MNVSLTPELEHLVNSKVAAGSYHSASEVVREGLRLLQQRDETQAAKLAWLRAEVQKGMDDLDAGRIYDGPEVMASIRKRLLKEKKRKNG